MQKAQPQFQALHARILAISSDSTKKQKALQKRLKVTFPLLSDASLKVSKTYKVVDARLKIARPAIFVIDQKGAIRWSELSTVRKRPPEKLLLDALRRFSRPTKRAPARRD